MDGKRNKVRRNRLIVLAVLLSVFWLALEANLFRLQVLDHQQFNKIADNQYLKRITLPARRGMILDRNGEKLASNTIQYDLAADPELILHKSKLARLCAMQFGGTVQAFEKKLNGCGRFKYLARKISKDHLKKFIALNDPGILTPNSFRRQYPYGAYAAQLLGFTDPDNRGLSGLELQFDSQLRGKKGEAVLQYDGPRRVFFNADNPIKPPQDGQNIVLTIDKNIQTVLDQELAQGVKAVKAKNGLAVIIEPFSGRILAMANYPSFDLNRQQKYKSETVKRNRVITDVYEPGSTMKVITAAVLLQEQLKRPSDLVYCGQGSYRLFNRVFHDSRKHGWLTFKKVIEKSSNIGTIKLSSVIKPNLLFRYFKNFGFGSKTGVGLIGEAEGFLPNPQKWNRVTKASLSIGYGISVTALQMAAAYAAVVNGGYLYRPYVVDHLTKPNAEITQQARPEIIRQILSKEVSAQLKAFMLGVVKNGTGKKAKPQNIEVGGKTGTAKILKPDRSGYYSKRYVASFVGFAPYNRPQYVCAVVVNEPRSAFYGGSVAAPIFRKVIRRIINLEKEKTYLRFTQNTQQQRLIKKITDLPPLDGFEPAYAKALLEARNIKYKIEGQGPVVRSHSIDGKRVILQRGQLLVKNATVPKVVGLTLREAISKIDLARFRINIKGQSSGLVRKQEPPPGQKISERTTLTLTCR